MADQLPLDLDIRPTDTGEAQAPAPEPSRFRDDSSLRDALSRQLADDAEAGKPSAPTDTSLSGKEKQETSPPVRQRDGTGRFAKQGEPDGATATPTAKPAPEAAPPEPHADEVMAKAPSSWKPDKAPLWDKVAPEARAYIHERERELQTGFQQAAQVRQVAESILSEFQPYESILREEGATPAQAMRTLLQTAYALRSAQPEYRKAIFLQLAQQYGVDMSSGFDPNLANTQGELSRLQIERMEQQTRAQASQQSEMTGLINQFASQPEHEFFPKVREIMGRIISAGLAPDLESAYQQAVRLSPEVSAEIERRGVLAAENARREAARQTASRLGGGGAPGLGGPAGGAPPTAGFRGKVDDVRSSVEQAWAAMQGGS